MTSLKTKDRFLLCGDAHQIVHPNFFSWASVRALFREAQQDESVEAAAARDVTVLQANFRNTRAVTALANRLLKIKQARFGSVDRESSFLVKCASPAAGQVRLLKAEEKALKALDASSRASVHSAVIVLRDEDKAAARAHFRTPLVFSVHEAKGLEYPNVILFNLVSGNRAVYADLCRDVVAADLEGDELDYRRAKDKADKSLELNKFYVNALYVAMTRAMEGLGACRVPTSGILCWSFSDSRKSPKSRQARFRRRPGTNGRRKRGSSNCKANRSKRGPYGKLFWRAVPRRGPRGL